MTKNYLWQLLSCYAHFLLLGEMGEMDNARDYTFLTHKTLAFVTP